MSKVLWLGDGGCHTGFSRVTHHIGERLVQYGHEIHVLAINYKGEAFPGALRPAEATPLHLYRPDLLIDSDVYGMSRIVEMLAMIEPDVVVMLNDPHVILQLLFENRFDPNKVLLQYRPILTYVPCDGYNLPSSWQMLTKATHMVAMTKFGQVSYPGSSMVYHGIDEKNFWPVREKPVVTSTGAVLKSKADCKAAFGFNPDGFLVLRVDSNSGRKDMAATWKAMVPVMKRHADVELHLHCASAEMQSGINVRALNDREPDIASRVHTPDYPGGKAWPDQDLNALYNAADVFVSTSRGEGFGLTIAEALTCAVPVIAQNVSAIPEIVGPGGILIEPQRQITVPSGEDVWLADIDAFTAQIEYLYEASGVRRKLGEAGREHVLTSFSWDVAAARFHEWIGTLSALATDTSEATDGPD